MLAAIGTAIVEQTLGPIRGGHSFHLNLGLDKVNMSKPAFIPDMDAVCNILNNMLKGCHPILIDRIAWIIRIFDLKYLKI